ncbi:uncharacterized protein LOC124541672 [Vanessa cardui]|uniref:uncharacterized protein LOC124541672 n=1 Tax=Vanessa cardui TaxID=171605 RepID=UPI001F1457CC|nr:uncharacterized protein LOC124541672 [Vanessa cardui]
MMTAKISKSTRKNCYFGCDVEGPLHHFPVPENDVERFEIWKAVLENNTKKRGNIYIYNQLRLCNNHFENYYILPSNRLTRNAIPTLNIKRDDVSVRASTSTEISTETGTEVLMDQATKTINITKSGIKQKFVAGQGNHVKVIKRLIQRV